MIRNANLNDLNEIAKLHTESFEDHFLPKLGLKLLANYYKEFMDENNIFIVSINQNNRIDGFVLGTQNSAIGRKKFIENNKIALSLRVALLCLKFDKDTWDRIKGFIEKLFLKREKKVTVNNDLPSFKVLSLLSICVAKNAKGTGVSKALVEEFEKRVKQLGYEGYTLTVRKANNRANNFYKKIGMDIYKESDSEYGYIKKLIDS